MLGDAGAEFFRKTVFYFCFSQRAGNFHIPGADAKISIRIKQVPDFVLSDPIYFGFYPRQAVVTQLFVQTALPPYTVRTIKRTAAIGFDDRLVLDAAILIKKIIKNPRKIWRGIKV